MLYCSWGIAIIRREWHPWMRIRTILLPMRDKVVNQFTEHLWEEMYSSFLESILFTFHIAREHEFTPPKCQITYYKQIMTSPTCPHASAQIYNTACPSLVVNLHQLWTWSQHHWQAEGSPLLAAYQEQLHPGVSSGMCLFSLPECRWRWPAAIWYST